MRSMFLILILLTLAMRSKLTPVEPEIPDKVSPGFTIHFETQPSAPLGDAGVDVGSLFVGSGTVVAGGFVGVADELGTAEGEALLLAEGVALAVLPGVEDAEIVGEGVGVGDADPDEEADAEGDGEALCDGITVLL